MSGKLLMFVTSSFKSFIYEITEIFFPARKVLLKFIKNK